MSRAFRWVAPLILLGGALACHEGAMSAADVEGEPDAAGEVLDPDEAISELEVIQSPASVLSLYVEWTTLEEVVTDLEVDCGEAYSERFTGSRPRSRHEVFVMFLVAGESCLLTAYAAGSGGVTTREATFSVPPLPEYLPGARLETVSPTGMQPGFTLTSLTNTHDQIPLSVAMLDERGRIRWVYQLPTTYSGGDNDTRTVPGGVLIGGCCHRLRPRFVDWEGELVWEGPLGNHHEFRLDVDPSRYILLGRADGCDVGGPPEFSGSVLQLDRGDASEQWRWDMCDYYAPDPFFEEWSHMNSAAQFPGEDALLVSSRELNSLVKVDRATGEIDWIMGFNGRPEDGFRGDFEMAEADRFLRQHAPEIQPTGSILLFDNGLAGLREWSRAVEIAYDEQTMEARVVWEYRPQPDLFSYAWSDADRLANGNTLVTFGRVVNQGAPHAIFIEVTAEGDEVWRLALPDHWEAYRAERVVDPPMGWVIEP